MKIVIISDTHLRHDKLALPPGDILIHCGDFSMLGKRKEVRRFLNWFSSRPYHHRILIAGNHDVLCERAPEEFKSLVPEGVTYLNDSGVEIDGIKFWGSPIQPKFGRWAFQRERGKEIARHWEMIPQDTDVLLTHGPPHLILDYSRFDTHAGCESLREHVFRIQPKMHCFGHIHEHYGVHREFMGADRSGGILFVNAASCSRKYKLAHKPVVVDMKGRNKEMVVEVDSWGPLDLTEMTDT